MRGKRKGAPAPKKPRLTDRQLAFCRAFALSTSPTYNNGAASAEAAGYNGGRNTLKQAAHQMLKYNGLVQEEIRRLQQQENKTLNISCESVLAGLSRLQNRAERDGKPQRRPQGPRAAGAAPGHVHGPDGAHQVH